MTDTNQPQTWRKVRSMDLGHSHDPDDYTVCAPDMPDGEDFIEGLSETQANRLIEDHAAATRLADALADRDALAAALEAIRDWAFGGGEWANSPRGVGPRTDALREQVADALRKYRERA